MFIENLIKLGFTEKEAQVYLMLFRTGPTPASTLAQRVQMKRVSIYTILEALCGKGVVSYEQTEMGRRYIPHDPECLYEQLEREKAGIQAKLSVAKNCVEALQAPQYYRQINGQRVYFFKGEKSICRALEIYLETGKDVHYLIPLSLEEIKTDEVMEKVILNAHSRNMKWTLYAPSEITAKLREKWKDFPFVEINTLPQKGHLFVQGDRVFFLSKTNSELELMLIIDSNYAKLIAQVIFNGAGSNKQKSKPRTPQEVQQSAQTSLL